MSHSLLYIPCCLARAWTALCTWPILCVLLFVPRSERPQAVFSTFQEAQHLQECGSAVRRSGVMAQHMCVRAGVCLRVTRGPESKTEANI